MRIALLLIVLLTGVALLPPLSEAIYKQKTKRGIKNPIKNFGMKISKGLTNAGVSIIGRNGRKILTDFTTNFLPTSFELLTRRELELTQHYGASILKNVSFIFPKIDNHEWSESSQSHLLPANGFITANQGEFTYSFPFNDTGDSAVEIANRQGRILLQTWNSTQFQVITPPECFMTGTSTITGDYGFNNTGLGTDDYGRPSNQLGGYSFINMACNDVPTDQFSISLDQPYQICELDPTNQGFASYILSQTWYRQYAATFGDPRVFSLSKGGDQFLLGCKGTANMPPPTMCEDALSGIEQDSNLCDDDTAGVGVEECSDSISCKIPGPFNTADLPTYEEPDPFYTEEEAYRFDIDVTNDYALSHAFLPLSPIVKPVGPPGQFNEQETAGLLHVDFNCSSQYMHGTDELDMPPLMYYIVDQILGMENRQWVSLDWEEPDGTLNGNRRVCLDKTDFPHDTCTPRASAVIRSNSFLDLLKYWFSYDNAPVFQAYPQASDGESLYDARSNWGFPSFLQAQRDGGGHNLTTQQLYYWKLQLALSELSDKPSFDRPYKVSVTVPPVNPPTTVTRSVSIVPTQVIMEPSATNLPETSANKILEPSVDARVVQLTISDADEKEHYFKWPFRNFIEGLERGDSEGWKENLKPQDIFIGLEAYNKDYFDSLQWKNKMGIDWQVSAFPDIQRAQTTDSFVTFTNLNDNSGYPASVHFTGVVRPTPTNEPLYESLNNFQGVGSNLQQAADILKELLPDKGFMGGSTNDWRDNFQWDEFQDDEIFSLENDEKIKGLRRENTVHKRNLDKMRYLFGDTRGTHRQTSPTNTLTSFYTNSSCTCKIKDPFGTIPLNRFVQQQGFTLNQDYLTCPKISWDVQKRSLSCCHFGIGGEDPDKRAVTPRGCKEDHASKEWPDGYLPSDDPLDHNSGDFRISPKNAKWTVGPNKTPNWAQTLYTTDTDLGGLRNWLAPNVGICTLLNPTSTNFRTNPVSTQDQPLFPVHTRRTRLGQ